MKTKYTQKNLLTTLLLVCLVIVLSAAKCQKENAPPGLPPATETGENVFACKINGEIWESYYAPIPITAIFIVPVYNPRLSISYNESGAFSIIARRNTRHKSEEPRSDFSLRIEEGVFGEGEYLFNTPKDKAAYHIEGTDNTSSCRWVIDSLINGKLTITRYDTVENIFSGRFYFTANLSSSSEDCNNEIIEVTEGRFDIKKE